MLCAILIAIAEKKGWAYETGNHTCGYGRFFAAIEQRDNPALQGKPVIVGGSKESRGVVSTASYEARKFGVHSAMSMAEAVRRCPDGIYLPVDMKKIPGGVPSDYGNFSALYAGGRSYLSG